MVIFISTQYTTESGAREETDRGHLGTEAGPVLIAGDTFLLICRGQVLLADQ